MAVGARRSRLELARDLNAAVRQAGIAGDQEDVRKAPAPLIVGRVLAGERNIEELRDHAVQVLAGVGEQLQTRAFE